MPVDPRIPGITLKQGESVVVIAKPHWIVFLSLGRIISYVVTIGIALVWLILKWKNEVYVLTTERVIAQRGVISKAQQSVALDKIQDVQFAIKGILARLIGVGHVYVETAGSASNIEMLAIPKPQQIVDQIQNQISAHKKKELMEMAKAMKGEAG